MAVLDVLHIRIWEGLGEMDTLDAKYDTDTGYVFDIDKMQIGILTEDPTDEYIILPDGTDKTVKYDRSIGGYKVLAEKKQGTFRPARYVREFPQDFEINEVSETQMPGEEADNTTEDDTNVYVKMNITPSSMYQGFDDKDTFIIDIIKETETFPDQDADDSDMFIIDIAEETNRLSEKHNDKKDEKSNT